MEESVLSIDNYTEISNHIQEGSLWKVWIVTCKAFYRMNNSERVAKYSNHLLTLLKMYPDPPGGWNWYYLSMNPNITWDIVTSPWGSEPPIGERWDYYGLSGNPNITWNIIKNNPEREWKSFWLSENPNPLTTGWDIVKNNPSLPNGDPWYWTGLSMNPNITMDIVLSNPDKPWNLSSLSTNPNITFDIIKNFFPQLGGEWDWCALSRNPNITWDILISPEGRKKPWNLYDLSMNPNPLTTGWDIITSPEGQDPSIGKWSWNELSGNPNITWDIVKNNPSPPGGKWNLGRLSANPNITWDIVKNNPSPLGGEWSWSGLSENPNITWEIVKNNIDKPWDWYWLSKNKFNKKV